ncbi:hypothetical protein STRTUCAR8_05606 [Streptomyces turgidiscabies Car8]|uniref:Uncharacterized protein n=1 Tax=Streptomyces turgidiscabies (strain Car8) TaxID=698760 RepID=L7EXN0_STRT8|nr:hypothetical protein [Streptomyces turgidiscabies]ELP64168.1 hypothetical protein STRTUCAR8_05606 [Streptomyces turgidiscabies Car8]
MTSATQDILRTATLPVPALGSLRPEQIRGEACVWGGGLLDSGAVDLGRRSGTLMGIVGPWEPRACTSCVHAAVWRALRAHDGTCTPCSRGEACDARRALRRHAWEDGR